MGAGRYYNEQDEAARARVAIIGQKIAERMFGTMQLAIGQRITIDGASFEVIGVNTTKAGFIGDPQNSVIIPYSAARNWLYRNQFNQRVDVSNIIVQAHNRNTMDAAIRQATEILRERHRLTYQVSDFTVLNLEQLMRPESMALLLVSMPFLAWWRVSPACRWYWHYEYYASVCVRANTRNRASSCGRSTAT